MIASGEKREEYREIKPYWSKRLSRTKNAYIFLPEPYSHIIFTNGYANNAPKIKVECLGIKIGTAKPEWSDNWQGNVFRIKLGKIITNNTNNGE